MKKHEHVEYWLRSADNDLKAANTLFKSARYDWCLFIGHLVLDEVNDFNLVTRYPDYKLDFYKLCTKKYADKYFKEIKRYYGWLKSHLK